MTHIRYDIIPQSGGWSIAMGGAVGPPYLELNQAVRDTEHVAALLSGMATWSTLSSGRAASRRCSSASSRNAGEDSPRAARLRAVHHIGADSGAR